MKKIIIAYVPVLHEGYRRLFEKYSDAELFIFGEELIAKFDYLYKEIRALKPEIIKNSLETWKLNGKIKILSEKELDELSGKDMEIIMPNEDIMYEIKEKYFSDKKVIFDDIFLRWDKHNTLEHKPVHSDKTISEREFDKKMMQLVYDEGMKSSDWWRRMGCIVVKDGKILITTRNKHVPSDQMPYANGDPRSCWHRGVHLDLSTVLHSEAGAIALAAKNGISLEGAQMYVGTFPCPPCAKSIAYSGIKKLYYREGYGVLDGEDILKSQGVEIIFVDANIETQSTLGDTEYKK